MTHRRLHRLQGPLPSIETMRGAGQDGNPTLSELFRRELTGPDPEGHVRGSILPAVQDPEGNVSFPRVPGAAQDLFRSVGRFAKGIRGEGEVGVSDAFNMASAGTAGGIGAARAGISGDLGIFGGMRASKASKGFKSNRLKAERMDKAGRPPEDILATTGFSKGADGRWRFEISDDAAIIKQVTTAEPTVGEVLIHPRLYRQYPDLEDVPLEPFQPGMDGIPEGVDAIYQPKWGDQPEVIGIRHNVSSTEAKSLLLHELQHAVQFREGFAVGGETSKEFVQRAAKVLIGRMKKSGNKQAVEEAEMSLEAFNRMPERSQQIEISRFYNRMAGEVEARNVQERQGMHPFQRRLTPPQDTEDVPRFAQVVLSREELIGGLAQSILGLR